MELYIIILMIALGALLAGILIFTTSIQNSRTPPDFSLSRSDGDGSGGGGSGGDGGDGGGSVEITEAQAADFLNNRLKYMYATNDGVGGDVGQSFAVLNTDLNSNADPVAPIQPQTFDVRFVQTLGFPPATSGDGVFGTATNAQAYIAGNEIVLLLDTTGKLSIVIRTTELGGYINAEDYVNKEQPRFELELATTTETDENVNIGSVQIFARQNPLIVDSENNFLKDELLTKRFSTADVDPKPAAATQDAIADPGAPFQTEKSYYYKYEYQLTQEDITSSSYLFTLGAFGTFGLNAAEQREFLKNLQITHVDGQGRHIYLDSDGPTTGLSCISVSADITDNDFLDAASAISLREKLPVSFDYARFGSYGAITFAYYAPYNVIIGVSQNARTCLVYIGPVSDVSGGAENTAFVFNTITTLSNSTNVSFTDVTFPVDVTTSLNGITIKQSLVVDDFIQVQFKTTSVSPGEIVKPLTATYTLDLTTEGGAIIQANIDIPYYFPVTTDPRKPVYGALLTKVSTGTAP